MYIHTPLYSPTDRPLGGFKESQLDFIILFPCHLLLLCLLAIPLLFSSTSLLGMKGRYSWGWGSYNLSGGAQPTEVLRQKGGKDYLCLPFCSAVTLAFSLQIHGMTEKDGECLNFLKNVFITVKDTSPLIPVTKLSHFEHNYPVIFVTF